MARWPSGQPVNTMPIVEEGIEIINTVTDMLYILQK